MKTWDIGIRAIISVCSLAAFAAGTARAEQNLLPNGDFSDTQQIAGWTSFQTTGSATFSASVDATGGASGSLQVTAAPDTDGFGRVVSSPCMAVAPGATYRYGGKIAPASDAGVAGTSSFSCAYYKDDQCFNGGDVPVLGSPPALSATGSGPFQNVAVTAGVLDGAARGVRCQVRVVATVGGTTNAQAYFDDLFFASSPPAASTVKLAGYLSGNWYDPAHAGQGLQLEFTDQANTLIAVWFVYAPDGSGQRWIFAQGTYDPAAYEVTLYAQLLQGAAFPPQFNAADAQRTLWGKLTFVFTDCDHGQLVWNGFLPGYGSGSMPLTRLTSIRGTSCPR